MTSAAQPPDLSQQEEPRFAVRIGCGLVTHWCDVPLTSREMADECCRAIQRYTGEQGEVTAVDEADAR